MRFIKKIKTFILVIITRVSLALKILFTLDIIKTKKIQGNNIILIFSKTKKADFIDLIMDEKKLLHASKLYKRKSIKKETAKVIIKPYEPSIEQVFSEYLYENIFKQK